MAHLVHRVRSGDRQRALLVAAYEPGTIGRYASAVQRFLDWLREHGVDFNDSSINFEDLDYLLTEFLHYARASGMARSIGEHALSGLLRYLPHAKHHLPDAHTALRGWGRLAEARSHPPITYNLACLVAVQMARHGQAWLRDAVGVLLAFDCLLRVGELCGIRREHVGDGCDDRLGTARPGASHGLPGVAPAHDTLLIALPRTKTGRNQSVYVGSPAAKLLLRRLLTCTAPGELVFPSSPALFRRRFQAACSELRLPARYVPHSLRHGGDPPLPAPPADR